MSSPEPKHAQIVKQLEWELRNLSTSVVLSASAVAQRVGMGASDWKCAELLVRNGPMTAGQLARLSGLTTGAITGVVDRLERAGWACRQPDPSDRRRVIIQPGPQHANNDPGLYEVYMQSLGGLLARYEDEELEIILDFVRRLVEVNHQAAAE